MDQQDLREMAAELLFLSAATQEILHGLATMAGDRDAFVRVVISGIHERLDLMESASGEPAHALLLETARRRADALLQQLRG